MEEIERLAEEFLARVPAYVWDGETLPVPIEDIADTHLGLLVRDVDDLRRAPGAPVLDDGHALSGLLLPALGEIWVNASEARDWPPRCRFTVAHELGHWSLHRDADRSVFCRSNVIEPDATPDTSELPLSEQEANAFGAAVLMPGRLIREQYVHCGRDFSSLCENFGASGAAMGRRLARRDQPDRGSREVGGAYGLRRRVRSSGSQTRDDELNSRPHLFRTLQRYAFAAVSAPRSTFSRRLMSKQMSKRRDGGCNTAGSSAPDCSCQAHLP